MDSLDPEMSKRVRGRLYHLQIYNNPPSHFEVLTKRNGMAQTEAEFNEAQRALSDSELVYNVHKLQGKPWWLEHTTDDPNHPPTMLKDAKRYPIGEVFDTYQDPKTSSTFARMRCFDTPEGWWMARALEDQKMMCGASLGHRRKADGTIEMDEVSSCWKGARPETGCVRIEPFDFSQMEQLNWNGPVYKVAEHSSTTFDRSNSLNSSTISVEMSAVPQVAPAVAAPQQPPAPVAAAPVQSAPAPAQSAPAPAQNAPAPTQNAQTATPMVTTDAPAAATTEKKHKLEAPMEDSKDPALKRQKTEDGSKPVEYVQEAEILDKLTSFVTDAKSGKVDVDKISSLLNDLITDRSNTKAEKAELQKIKKTLEDKVNRFQQHHIRSQQTTLDALNRLAAYFAEKNPHFAPTKARFAEFQQRPEFTSQDNMWDNFMNNYGGAELMVQASDLISSGKLVWSGAPSPAVSQTSQAVPVTMMHAPSPVVPQQFAPAQTVQPPPTVMQAPAPSQNAPTNYASIEKLMTSLSQQRSRLDSLYSGNVQAAPLMNHPATQMVQVAASAASSYPPAPQAYYAPPQQTYYAPQAPPVPPPPQYGMTAGNHAAVPMDTQVQSTGPAFAKLMENITFRSAAGLK